jgi:hypothetical protein
MTVIRADFTVRGAADSGVPEPGSIVLLGTSLLVIAGAAAVSPPGTVGQ